MKKNFKRYVSNSFTKVIPYAAYGNNEPGWRDGMISGNGENGVACSCAPYSDTLSYQNMYLLMPSPEPRFVPPELTGQLEEARQAVINFDDTWNVHDRIRTYLYHFHPSHQLRIEMQEKELLNYQRETDFETAEVIVRYEDSDGKWMRRTFTSREDNVIITEITKSDRGTRLNLTLSIDDLSGMRKFGSADEAIMQYKKIADEDCTYIGIVGHYPDYEGSELRRGGYSGITRVVVSGGNKIHIYGEDTNEKVNVGIAKNPMIKIMDADAVYLIAKSERTHDMGDISEFKDMQKYDLVETLLDEIQEVTSKYMDDKGAFTYDAALVPHKEKHSKLFNNVSFSLGDEVVKQSYNEELIIRQQESEKLVEEFIERVYDLGCYVQICCAGYSAPRLCGLWTGEWCPGWRGAYTMDANVNIQVSGMNTGNVYDAAIGYIYFILRQIEDWEDNAAMAYGMRNAILPPVNTDGDVAVLVEYDNIFPFQYWNAGASWLILPIYEFWQCFGNQKIPVNHAIRHIYAQDYLDLEKDVLLPLLEKQANYWEQLCTPEYFTGINGRACYEKGKKELLEGEKYLIIPSYSPENMPLGYRSAITANAAMDISAARDGLLMTIAILEAVGEPGCQERISKLKELMTRLPEYRFDDTGALCEWAMEEYKENNEHRHISHLYCAWPAYETQEDAALAAACNIAVENRNRVNDGKDDTASHGWVHKGLVAARLKNAESAYHILHTLMSGRIYFTSLITNHNTDGSGIYCTDTTLGMVGIINEMLMFSNTGVIELLPALPDEWKTGVIRGLMTRTRAELIILEWDMMKGIVKASIRSHIPQTIRLFSGLSSEFTLVKTGQALENGTEITLKKDEMINIEWVQV